MKQTKSITVTCLWSPTFPPPFTICRWLLQWGNKSTASMGKGGWEISYRPFWLLTQISPFWSYAYSSTSQREVRSSGPLVEVLLNLSLVPCQDQPEGSYLLIFWLATLSGPIRKELSSQIVTGSVPQSMREEIPWYIDKTYRDKTYRRQNLSGQNVSTQNISPTKRISYKTYRRQNVSADTTYPRHNMSAK